MSLTVLVVDDNEQDRKLLRYNFDLQGYRILEAANGKAALELAASVKPDLIISDGLMPVMDGFQLLREIKENRELSEIPFIFYSSVYTGNREKDLALALGARAFIVKPQMPEQFWPEISRVMMQPPAVNAAKELISSSDEEFLSEYSRIVATKLEEKVSELETASQQIASSESRYRNLFASMRDVVIIADQSRIIIDVNQPALRTVLGYETDELLGRKTSVIYADTAQFELAGNEVFYRDDASAGKLLEIKFRRKSGEIFDGELFALKMHGNDGAPSGNIGVIRDITERKKLEAQYLHAQKMDSIGTLAGGVAHDFNNILTVIVGLGQVTLMKMAADDPYRHNVGGILEAADRATQLTKELLIFSRKQLSERKSMDLNEVVTRMDKFLPRVIGEDISLKAALHDSPLSILADSYQLEQVLMNLAINARDAMPKGGALIVRTEQAVLHEEVVTTDGSGKPGVYAVLSVSDNGVGMDKATQQRIFDPFFTTKEVGKGTGLGLAVVYGIIKQHEGFITVYSEPGYGSTFKIYLPLTATPIEVSNIRKDLTVAWGTETILLAEDDDLVRNLMEIVLKGAGYKVITATNGEDAVTKFKENVDSIQLLLFDLIMPRMNGKEASDEIHKISPGIKTIFSSGYTADTIQQKATLEYDSPLIPKPTSPVELLRKVRDVLDGII